MGFKSTRAPRRRWRPTAATLAVAASLAAAAALLAPGGAPSRARAAGLVADLSHHLIAITTAFVGSEVLLFGIVGAPGRDVIVTVTGPPADTTVRRKTEVGFVWLNTQEVIFRAVPEFYAAAATGPLEAIADAGELERHRVGAPRLALDPISIEGVGDRQVPVFREALLRRKRGQGLYAERLGRVTFVGGGLFRTTLSFPADVPPGAYEVRVLELEQGLVVAAQTSSLLVSKVGLEAELFDVARHRSAIYGLASIALAVGAGWAASAIFGRS